jgi:hypothetical protein
LEVTDYDGLDAIPGVKALIDKEVQKVQNDINEKIPSGSTTRVMKGMSNASTLAGKGSTADYSSHMEKYQLSVALGGGADLERQTETDSDVSGVGIVPALMVGANARNLGVHDFAGLDTRRLDFYVNYLQWKQAEDMDPWVGMDSWLQVDTKSTGLRFGYQWKKGNENRNFTWGGMRISWGYQYVESHFQFEHDLNFNFDVDGISNIQGKVTGRPRYDVDVYTHSIPIELTSDITFFRILTLYGGAGVDFNYGTAKGQAKANGTVSPVACTDAGVCTSGEIIQLQGKAGANATGRVDPVTARGILGAQINLPYVQLYGTINKAINSELLGAAVGIRFVR